MAILLYDKKPIRNLISLEILLKKMAKQSVKIFSSEAVVLKSETKGFYKTLNGFRYI